MRIANSQLNFKTALVLPVGDLYDYIHKIRLEAKDSRGQDNWKVFSHLPLVSFIDREDSEEIVFKTEKDLPKEPCELITQRGELIARFT